MENIYIRGLPEDVHALLKANAQMKNMTKNEYLLSLLSSCAIAGSPSLQQLMPDAMQFVIRSIILSDDERRQAYTEAQLRLIKENMEVVKQVQELLFER